MVELRRIYWSRQAMHLGYSAAMVWLAASVVLTLMPRGNPGASQNVSSVADIFRAMFDAVLAAAAPPGLFVVAVLIAALVIRSQDLRRRDPVRRFTRQQRREGMARAGGQCEMEAGFRRRCLRPAEHGDHFYPWSKGGSTSLQNFVATCARAKSARIPSPGQQERMERRRRRDYLTPVVSVSVGERQPLP